MSNKENNSVEELDSLKEPSNKKENNNPKNESSEKVSISKKKFIAGVATAAILVGGLSGLSGYFGYRATHNNSGSVVSETKYIVNPATSSNANVTFEDDASGDKIAKVESKNGKLITGVIVTADQTVLVENTDYSVTDGNGASASKKVVIFKATLEANKGKTIAIAPVFESAPTPVAEKVVVTFNTNGGSTVEAQSVEKGSKIQAPQCTREGYVLKGWYTSDCQPFDFNNPINDNLILNAEWELPTSDNGLSFYVNEEDPETCSVYVYSEDSYKLPSRFKIPSTKVIDGTEYKVTRICAPATGPSEVVPGNKIPASFTRAYGAFRNCTNIIEVEIPDTVEFIDDYAFSECTSLTKVKLPSKCISIGESAFSGCSALEEINLEEGLLKIGASAFESCSNLKNIVIPDSVKGIGNACFARCNSLKTVKLGSGLTSLGYTAFLYCSSLESINIPYSILTIESGAFFGDSNLKKISFDDKESTWIDSQDKPVEDIIAILLSGDAVYKKAFAKDDNKKFAFHKLDNNHNVSAYYYDENTSALTGTIEVPETVEVEGVTYNVIALSDYCFEHATDYGCSGLEKIVLPNTIQRIGEFAFSNLGNDQMFSVVFKNPSDTISLKTIGDEAFVSSTVSSFNSETAGVINLPEGLISLGDRAFYNCKKITSVNIPSTLEDLKCEYDDLNDTSRYPFYNCPSITGITVDKNNKYYYSDEVGLYETESKTLLQAFGEATEGKLTYTVSDNVRIIGSLAFENYESVDLTLSSTVKEIDPYYLREVISSINLNGNQNFVFDTNNQGFYSVLNKDGDLKLLKIFGIVAKGGSFSLDTNTKIIGAYSFKDTGFKSITFNNKLEEIESYAFTGSGCNADSLVIPSSVTSVGYNAFGDLNLNEDGTITIESEYVANLTSNLTGIFKSNSTIKIKVPTSIEVSKSSYLKASGNYVMDTVDDYYIFTQSK